MTLALARVLAQSHADAGLEQFNALQNVAYEAKEKSRPVTFVEYVAKAVPAITSLSFAAELFLKVVAFQHFGVYPRSHDLVEMYMQLPTETRADLAVTYADLYSRPLPLQVVHFGLSAGPDSDRTPTSTMPPADTLADALDHLRSAFISWRYVYEQMAAPTSTDVNFKALLSVIECLNIQVRSHLGDSIVTLGVAPSDGGSVV